MDCNFEKICLFFEKKLPRREQLELFEHLNTCFACLKIARQLKINLYPESCCSDMDKVDSSSHLSVSRHHLTYTKN
jgi:hypothetical protein